MGDQGITLTSKVIERIAAPAAQLPNEVRRHRDFVREVEWAEGNGNVRTPDPIGSERIPICIPLRGHVLPALKNRIHITGHVDGAAHPHDLLDLLIDLRSQVERGRTVVSGPVTSRVTGSWASSKTRAMNDWPVSGASGARTVSRSFKMGRLSTVNESGRKMRGKGLRPRTVLSATGTIERSIKSRIFRVALRAALT
jgi:hypothetical protein